MFFGKAVLACAMAVAATAQTSRLYFTSAPYTMEAGTPQTIQYSAPDLTAPVTILLRKGDPTNLDAVSTLTTTATGGEFVWTPSTSLTSGTDYALEIQQSGNVNYFGPFELVGATAASSSASDMTTSSSPSGYTTVTASAYISASSSAYNSSMVSGTMVSSASYNSTDMYTAMAVNPTAVSTGFSTISTAVYNSTMSPVASYSSAPSASYPSSSSSAASSSVAVPSNPASAITPKDCIPLFFYSLAAVMLAC